MHEDAFIIRSAVPFPLLSFSTVIHLVLPVSVYPENQLAATCLALRQRGCFLLPRSLYVPSFIASYDCYKVA